MKWSFKIGSIMGIPVKVHLTFLLLLVLVFFAGHSVIGTGGLSGVVLVVLIFASVVFHEMSHSLVARHFGIPVEDITLLPIGGVSRMGKGPDEPSQEILIAIAGPVASLVLAFSLWFTADLIGMDVTVTDFSVKGGILPQLAAINLLLAIFNLLPAFPMDGGRVLRGVLALYFSPYTATRVAVGVGQVFAIGLFFLGLYSMNFFMVLIALFVYLGAEAEERQMAVMISLGGATAGTAMITDLETLSPNETVAHAAELYCHSFQQDFPVMDDSRLVGLLTRESITETLHRRGPSVLVREIMATDFPTVGENAPLTDVFEKMQTTGHKAIPIVGAAGLRGLITLEQIARYNMLCSGYSCDFLQPGKSSAAV
jgi:Zn-dependent protease/predicted transcriptional regulator